MDKTRHIGKIANTDQRCVVAFMQIPQRTDHALVIPTDNMPPRYEQAIMDLLRSPDGQNEECFAVALSRRLLPETGKDILSTLHEKSLLQAVPCSNIVMYPTPHQPIKLTDILVQLGRHSRASDDTMVSQQNEKFNPHANNMRANDAEQKHSIASNLIIEARMLEEEANKKRELAYGYDPSLRPRQRTEPVFTPPALTDRAETDILSLDALLAD